MALPQTTNVETELPKPTTYGWQIILGIIFPVLAASFELVSGFCRLTFFDPLPNVWSCIVFALIPIGNAIVVHGLKHPSKNSMSRLLLANGVAIGASVYFSLIFLSLLPMSVLGSLMLVGLCGLTPYLALVCACRLHTRLVNMRTEYKIAPPERITSLGVIVGFLLLAPIGFSALTTNVALGWVEKGTFEQREKGIRWLENYASTSVLAHRAAGKQVGYYSWGSSSNFFGGRPTGSSITPEWLYRLTGQSFPQLDRPTWRSGRPIWNPFYMSQPTPRQGIDGLSLEESVIDGWADGDGMVGYLEWTMVVRNNGSRNQEAVGTIQLPKGATVSRVTLWVNGEEREAAFSAKAKVTEAYQRVVRRKRDPILITTDGLDRIEVRCFPVIRGESMQFRIGITMPLELESSTAAVLPLPYFLDRNFTVPAKIKHHLWVESRGDLEFPGKNVSLDITDEGKHRLQVAVAGHELSSIASAIQVSRRDVSKFWNVWGVGERPVVGTLREVDRVFRPTVVVLDGSWAMRSRWDDVLDLLRQATNVKEIVLAGEESQTYEFDSPDARKRTLKALQNYKPNRGRNNIAALRAAWSSTIGVDNSQIVWIHAPKPFALATVTTLLRRFSRSNAPDLVDVPVLVGPNVVIDGLPLLRNVYSVPLLGENIDTFWDRVERMGSLPFQLERGSPPANAHKTSRHLSRLWAVQSIIQGLKNGKEWDDLVPIAEQYRIVSPVSGAVVLETNSQYHQAGLRAPKNNLPQTATPAALLLLVGLALLTAGGLLTRVRVRI